MLGQRFGKLVVIERGKQAKGRGYYLHCKCDCGETKQVLFGHLKSGRTKTCGCGRRMIGPNHSQYAGTENISGSYWYSLQNSSKKRNLEFTITQQYLEQIYKEQDGCCAITGLKLRMPTSPHKRSRQETDASLDRIDSKLGYIPGNVQWVHKDVNRIKWAFRQERLLELCVLTVNHAKKKGLLN